MLLNNVRYFLRQVNCNKFKKDSITNSNIGLIKRTFSVLNQRLLINLKHEIKIKNKNLIPLLIKSLSLNIWPMLKYAKQITELVTLKQKYLAILSLENGFDSLIVNNQMVEWVCSLIF